MRRETLERMRDAMMKVMRKVAKACGSASERAPASIASIAVFSSSAPLCELRRGRQKGGTVDAPHEMIWNQWNAEITTTNRRQKYSKKGGVALSSEQRPRRPSR